MTEINKITKENCGVLLAALIEKEEIGLRDVAKAITCPDGHPKSPTCGHLKIPHPQHLPEI